jgi:hypothetical protein
MVVRMKGYVIEDSSDLSLADFNDAVAAHENERDCCGSEFGNYGCTRAIGHTGPHIAATGPDAITAVWEEDAL